MSCLDVIPFNNADSFFYCKIKPSLSLELRFTSFRLTFALTLSGIIKRIIFYSVFDSFHISKIYFSFLPYKKFRAMFTLFFSNFSQSSFSDEKCILSQLCLFIKSLIFVYSLRILFDFFMI